MSLHLGVLAGYSIALMVLGLWIGRRVRGTSDFFVASRSLGPGLIFSTMLAANIGAGSTVGATSTAYSSGVSAWWWVGSAALGCFVLAMWVGPRMRRIAAAENLRTVGDYLEFLNVVAGIPTPIGCAIGGLVITVYFAAGGLLTSARVNVVQLTVKMLGFAVALPIALSWFGGWSAVLAVHTDVPSYWTFAGADAVKLVMLLAPAFIVSPGLLQKVFGAADDRAVRLGVGLNALGLALFAGVPTLLGIMARGKFPEIAATPNLALPMIFMYGLPPLIGAVALAAVFSAEVSAADAVLFMLATSLSQDLYKRFVNREADDQRVLVVARIATLVSGVLGVTLAVYSTDLVDTLKIFYALLGVSLFVPIIAGLYVTSATADAAVAAVIGGVGGMLVVQGGTGGAGFGLLGPAPVGIVMSALGWAVVMMFPRQKAKTTRH